MLATEPNVSQEYLNLVPRMPEDEYQTLKEDIQQYGQQVPIIINQNGIVLDGHHRFRACTELGIQVKYEVKHFDNKLAEEIYVIKSALLRRHLTKFAYGELLLKLKPRLAELAKENERKGGEQKGFINIDKPLHVKKELVKDKKISEGSLYKVEKIVESDLPEEVKDKARTGKTSIEYVYKQVKRSEDNKKERPPLPQGQFDVILADPPWKYDINTRGSPDEHYGVMEDDAITNMKVPAADNAVLFLWATGPKLKEALEVMEGWGFTYKTQAVWIKNHIGTGYWFRGQHELLLVGVKGKGVGVPEEKDRHSSVIQADISKHSVKPQIVYEIIERMHPRRKYLELFGRGTARKGWTVWGDEVINK